MTPRHMTPFYFRKRGVSFRSRLFRLFSRATALTFRTTFPHDLIVPNFHKSPPPPRLLCGRERRSGVGGSRPSSTVEPASQLLLAVSFTFVHEWHALLPAAVERLGDELRERGRALPPRAA